MLAVYQHLYSEGLNAALGNREFLLFICFISGGNLVAFIFRRKQDGKELERMTANGYNCTLNESIIVIKCAFQYHLIS